MTDADPGSFTVRWMQAQPAVACVLMAMVRDPATVDDLLQETALAAVKAIDTYDPSRPFAAWAIGIARHRALHWLRARERHPGRMLAAGDLDRLAAAALEENDELQARMLRLHACLDKLSPRAARAVELHYGEDLPQATVAERLGLAAGAVRVLLHRTRARLRACIGELAAGQA